MNLLFCCTLHRLSPSCKLGIYVFIGSRSNQYNWYNRIAIDRPSKYKFTTPFLPSCSEKKNTLALLIYTSLVGYIVNVNIFSLPIVMFQDT